MAKTLSRGFEATVNAANVLQSASNSGALTVDTTASTVGYDATIHFEVEDPGAKLIELTTWDSGVLKKGTVPVGGVVGDVNLTTATVADETYVLAVKAWITDDSADDGTGHADRFFAGLQSSSSETRKVTYSYTGKTPSNTILGTGDVYFYCAATSTTYTEASEGISGASGKRQQLSVSVSDLLYDSNEDSVVDAYNNASNKKTIGYLYVRFEGSTRIHSDSNTYTATIDATAGTSAAANNA